MVSCKKRRKLPNNKMSPASSAESASQQVSPEGIPNHPVLRHSRRLHPHDDSVSVKKELADAATNGDIAKPRTRKNSHMEASDVNQSPGKKSAALPSRRSLRSTRHTNVEMDQGDSSHEEDENAHNEREERRRSSRARRFTHSSYNEADITPLQPNKRTPAKTGSPLMAEDEEEAEEDDAMDMYTRVKRTRRRLKRDMYGMPLVEEEEKSTEDEETEQDENSGSEESEDEEGDDNEEEGDEDADEGSAAGHNLRHDKKLRTKSTSAKYNLRRNKPRTKLYEATIEKKRRYFKMTPPKGYNASNEITFKSPAHRYHRRKRASHRTSSTSSSGSESEDERRFNRRKNKSMAKARQRCLPMNLLPGDLSHAMKDRQRIGASLADIDPMSVDRSITFDSVGGLNDHVQALKEMIVFPLLYPEVFERFKIAPPRGVLFHGPPGTGKTLVARALANECSTGEKKVAFFMRKGADCLSKWVGESERQLRLLFDQAYQVRPSIIFFDEIDGLAPVRSSRQDQIHSSIVSTLLALMDGLDSRGEVVVIGATNRIDSIDPALRRPGRFDREFLFTLPAVEARAEILKIHTKEWNPKLLDRFIMEVAAKCNGYCGADMKALCTEAALHALRRRYPQIYSSKDKLQLDVATIDITATDFHYAMSRIVPAGQRAVVSPGRPLSAVVKPLLSAQLETLVSILNSIFPFIAQQSPSSCATTNLLNSIGDDSNPVCVTECNKSKRKSKQGTESTSPFLDFSVAAYNRPIVSRPRILIHGSEAVGNSTHLAPAVLHCMERLPIHLLDLPTLYANSSKTAEEACAQVFREARRSTPSVIYIPHIDMWWQVLSDTLQATFLMMLNDMDPLLPILILATCDISVRVLPTQIKVLFAAHPSELYQVKEPTDAEIRSFFEDLLLRQTCVPPVNRKQAANSLLEELPKAPVTKAQLTEAEETTLWDHEESVLRELRLFLRDMLNKLSRDRKFNIFSKPVDDEEVPDYYQIIKTPMDLSKMMSKIDLHQYQSCKEFLDDIDLICANALEYNPADSVAGRAIRHRACALKDTAHALIENELDEEFEQQCTEILDSRRNRGLTPSKAAPKYYHTKPLPAPPGNSANSPTARYSKRIRNEEVDNPQVATSSSKSNRCPGRVSHDITQDDILSPPRKKKKKSRSRWALGILSGKKKNKVHVEVETDETESQEEEEAESKVVLNGDLPSMADGRQPVVKLSVNDVSQAKVDLNQMFDNCDSSNDTNRSTLSNSPCNDTTVVNESEQNDHTEPSTDKVDETPATVAMDTKCDDSPSFVGLEKGGDATELTDINKPSSNPPAPMNASSPHTGATSMSAEDNTKEVDESNISVTVNGTMSSSSAVDKPEEMDESNASVQIDQDVSSTSADKSKEVDADKSKEVDASNGSDQMNSITTSPTQYLKAEDDVVKDGSGKNSPLIKEKVLEMEPPVKRLTRSMTHDQQENGCKEIIEEAIPAFTIDESKLPSLLDAAVNVGLRCTVVELEKLYSLLAQKIYHHRSSYNKTQLLQELNDILEGYTRN